MIRNDYRNRRSTTADEQSNAVEKWLTQLATVGIDTAKTFPNALEYLDRAQSLRVGSRTAQAEYDTLKDRISSNLADGTTTIAEIAAEISTAALAIATEERIREIVVHATKRAQSRAFNAMNLGEDRLLGLLRPNAKNLIAQIRKSSQSIPAGTYTQDAAIKAGRDAGRAWIEASADLRLLNEIHSLCDDFRSNFWIPAEQVRAEKYHPHQFRYAMPDLLDNRLYGPHAAEESPTSYFIRNLDAEPAILSIADVDNLSAPQVA